MADSLFILRIDTPGRRQFVMPTGFYPTVEIYCWGAGGGRSSDGSTGGGGGWAQTTTTFLPGDVITYQIGVQGKNGVAPDVLYKLPAYGGTHPTYSSYQGGDAGPVRDRTGQLSSGQGGGGGGASVVEKNGTAICIAGGGGGGGGKKDQGIPASGPGRGGGSIGINFGLQTNGGSSAAATSSGGGGGGGRFAGKAGFSYSTVQTVPRPRPGFLDNPRDPRLRRRPDGYGERSENGGSGGSNLGDNVLAADGPRGAGKTSKYFPSTSSTYGDSQYPGYIVIVLQRLPGLYLKNPDGSGQWKNIQNSLVKIQNAWRPITNVWTKVNGQWKQLLTDSGLVLNNLPPVPVPPPTFSITASTTSVNEGGHVTWAVDANNYRDFILYYKNVGTTSASDFTDSRNQGNVWLENGEALFYKTLRNDITTEGSETIIMTLRTGSPDGPVVATANVVTVNDTSLTRIYSISSNIGAPFTANEGTTISYTISAVNFGNGTLYYTMRGLASADDFTDNQSSGPITITSDSGTLIKTIKNDFKTEGTEQIVLELRTGSTLGSIVASTATPILINDTSVMTYSITPSRANVRIEEGNTIGWNINVQQMVRGTLYYENIGTVSAADFTDGTNSGYVTISDNIGGITKTLREDAFTEGDETIIMRLRTVEGGPIVATANVVTVLDSSQTLTFSVSPSTSVANEGDTVTFNVNTTGFGSGSLNWRVAPISSAVSSSTDFSRVSIGIRGGIVLISNNFGTFSITFDQDELTEGVEFLQIQLYRNSDSTQLLTTAAPVQVIDTSRTITYTITPSANVVNEGTTITWNVTATNFGTGTLYYYLGGSVVASDFTDNTLSGAISIVNDVGSFSKTVRNDLNTDGNDIVYAALRRGSELGTTVATSGVVNINDTSVTPPATYSLTRSREAVLENDSTGVTFTLSTTRLPARLPVPFTISGLGITSEDITSMSVNGNNIIPSRTENFKLLDNGTSTLQLKFRPNFLSGIRRIFGARDNDFTDELLELRLDNGTASSSVLIVEPESRFFTPSTFSYTVPAGVTQLRVTVAGAGGGAGGADPGQNNGAIGGHGSVITATIAVTPRETLTMYVASGGGVGSQGSAAPGGGGGSGYGSGGAGGSSGTRGSSGSGGGGGGGSAILRGGTPLIVAAGGGGGGGGGNDSAGRGLQGSPTYTGTPNGGAGTPKGFTGTAAPAKGTIVFNSISQSGVFRQTYSEWSVLFNQNAVWEANINAASCNRSYTFTVPTTGYYYIQLLVDNSATVSIDGVARISGSNTYANSSWPQTLITLTQGTHTLSWVATNSKFPGGIAVRVLFEKAVDGAGGGGGGGGAQGGTGGQIFNGDHGAYTGYNGTNLVPPGGASSSANNGGARGSSGGPGYIYIRPTL